MKVSTTICTYHRTINGDGNNLIKKFSRAGLDNFNVLFDNQKTFSKNEIEDLYESTACLYSDDDFVRYDFNKHIDKNHRWGSHQNPKYFYAHFRMLVFYLKNPNFDHYWFFDDDVDFEGDLKTLLDNYINEPEDFIAIQAFKKEDYKELPKVSIANNNMKGSHGHWLYSCPGPGDYFKSTFRHVGSFFPIVRFTKKSMNYLLELHKEGFYGYSEGFVPTSIASNGLGVASMMDEFNNFYIQNNNCKLFHKGSEFTWAWL